VNKEARERRKRGKNARLRVFSGEESKSQGREEVERKEELRERGGDDYTKIQNNTTHTNTHTL
jgi:hypothetical protein